MEQPVTIFITGISTDVGKTIASAIITQALKADYWKPLQSGGMDHSDRDEVRRLVSNDRSQFHPERYFLKTPMSPHMAAAIDGLNIELDELQRPETNNHLIIEGAGGLLVPLNDKNTIADLILHQDKVILVSSGYLGSINHTLLSIEFLKSRGLNCVGILYNQVTRNGTIEVIEKMTGIPTLGHLNNIVSLTSEQIDLVAQNLKPVLDVVI